MAKEKMVPFPEVLDGFGKDLIGIIETLKPQALRPAVLSDVLKVVSTVFAMQQLTTMMYNLNVSNYEASMNHCVSLEKKVEELKARIEKLEGEKKAS
jgi:hypothetical protein